MMLAALITGLLAGRPAFVFDTPKGEMAAVLSSARGEKGDTGGDESQRVLPMLPELSSRSYLVQAVGDARPLAQRNILEPMRPASITKLMTAVLAREELDAARLVEFSREAKSVGEKISSVPQGASVSRDDTMRLALVGSANDAAAALAEALGRHWGAATYEDAMTIFSQRVSKKAREIGMEHSLFRNPTGLDTDNHLTSARDLFLLAGYIWKRHPALWAMTRHQEAVVSLQSSAHALPGSEDSSMSPVVIASTNILLEEFPALLGGKTGWTDEAGETLIFLYPVRKSPVTLGIVVVIFLGSEDRFEDGRKIIGWLEEAYP